MMRTARPAVTSSVGAAPAASVPTTSDATGESGDAPAVSAARTAKPSMAVLSNGGTSSGASSGTEVARSRAPDRAAAPWGGPAAHEARTNARASPSVITLHPRDQTRPSRRHSSVRYLRKPGPRSSRIERELDRGAQPVELVADVVAAVGEREPVQRLALEQQRHRVGELDLAAASGLDAVDALEDLGSEHVAAHDRQIRRRLVGRGLLDEPDDAHERRPVLERLGRDAPVRRDLLGRELLAARSRTRSSVRSPPPCRRARGRSSTIRSSPSRTANGSSPT